MMFVTSIYILIVRCNWYLQKHCDSDFDILAGFQKVSNITS